MRLESLLQIKLKSPRTRSLVLGGGLLLLAATVWGSVVEGEGLGRSESAVREYGQPRMTVREGLLAANLLPLPRTGRLAPTRARSGTASSQASAQGVDFNRDILPVFQASCVRCHGADKAQA